MEITDIQLNNQLALAVQGADSAAYCFLMDNDVSPGQAYDIVYADTSTEAYERVNFNEISLEELLLYVDDAVL